MTGLDESWPPWERMQGESAKAHEAARVYFEMRASRSLATVAGRLGKHVSQMERWSKRHNWVTPNRSREALLIVQLRTFPPGIGPAAFAPEPTSA